MTPRTPGLVATVPNLNSNVNSVLNATLLDKPDIVPEFLQNNPTADTSMERLFAKLTAFRPEAKGRKTWQNLYVDNQFQNLHVNAHGAGAAGASVAITLNAASHLNGEALAFESYEYVGYSSITGAMFNGFVDFNGITRTTGAWVLTMFPTLATTGVIPAQNAGDPLRLLQPVTPEGNTTHRNSGRLTDIYSETKHMQYQENEGIEITDVGAWSDLAWAVSTQTIDGKTVTGSMWTNREIDLGIRQWHHSDMWGRLFNSGEMDEADAFGRPSSEGLWHWIENNSGNIFTFSGVVTDGDIEAWNSQLHDSYEDVGEYLIISGEIVSNAIQLWARGGHINGQHIMLEQSEFSVDFKKFTYNSITYHIPITPFSEFNNQFGLAEFDFVNKALFMPVGKTTTMNSTGGSVPYVEWKYLANGNPLFEGAPQGADHMWWELGPDFFRGVSEGPEWMKISDQVARCKRSKKEGNDFKKAQVFAILQR